MSAQMQKDGVTFANYFVTDSLCCPSRSSIFTGRYPHNTGIFRNVGPDGGYLAFLNRGHERATFAAALAAAGYRTAMLGKYLNGYQPRHARARRRAGANGTWPATATASSTTTSIRTARSSTYGRTPADYLTDVVSAAAVHFIKQSAGTPFMIEVATFAPHAPYTPAPRDAEAFPGLTAPRTPAFNAAPDADAPQWLRALPPLSAADIAGIDRDFRKRAQSVLAIDAMIGQLQAAVAAIGATDNTYFVFSSDNGYHMGEHRMMPGKMTAFDTDIHVPLIVTGPGVPAGRTRRRDRREHRPVSDLRRARLRGDAGRRRRPQPGAAAARTSSGGLANRGAGRASRPAPPTDRPGHAGTARRQPADLRGDPHRRARSMSNTPPARRSITTSPPIRTSCATPSRSLSPEEKASLHATLEAVQACHDAASCWTAERRVRSATRN